ncbi:MAG: Crp/Fnr family transcriptional regulator [Deltaproteobacteria bacterium]|nr:Crp/Fnr family transcriptional regulator [Deltaproteobacteria bacterium]
MEKNNSGSLLDLPLTEAQKKKLNSCMSEVRHAKGDVVFSQGDLISNLYILRSGLIKLVYYTWEGKELIKSFIQEGDLFGSLVSQLNRGGSTFSALCIEESCLQILPYSALESLVEESPEAQQFAINFFRELALKKETREYEFLCLSVEARYHKFMTDYPELTERIAQQDLARYLGITPIALSRIKHRQTGAGPQ